MGFTFNGISSKSVGITARLTEWQAAPKLRNYLVTIPSGDGVADLGCNLSEREIKIECSIMPRFSLGNLMSTVDNLVAWLNPKQGSQALVFDGLEDRYYNARISDAIDLERLAFSSGNFELRFICPDPYAYAMTDELFTISTTGSTTISRVKGNTDSYPLYSLKAVIPANGEPFNISTNQSSLSIKGPLAAGETLVIDAGKLTAYVTNASGTILRNGLPNLQNLNFPQLSTGSNVININTNGATFSQLVVEAHSRWQ